MPRDEEFRRVAEDVRALARSLAKDFREAVDQSRSNGHPTGQAFRHGLRGMADEAKRGVRTGWTYPPSRHRRGFYGGRGGWGHPPYARFPPPPGPPGATPGYPGGAAPKGGQTGGPVNWPEPPWSRRQRARKPLPPVRRRWDATTVIGLLVVLFGVAWLLGAVEALHVSTEAVVAVGLMLLGASLVITGRTDWSLSRRSWPVWLGAGLIAVLVATSSTFGVGGAFRHISFGSVSTSAPASGGTVHGGFGTLNVDATNWKQGTLTVDSVAGETFVENLPPDVQVNAHVLAGQICVNGRDVADGVGAQHSAVLAGSGVPLTLDVHQVFGQIVVGARGCAR